MPINQPLTADGLTEKQQKFVDSIMDNQAKSFGDIISALKSAGYKHGREPRATAIRLLANKNILKVLLQKAQKLRQTSIIRQETAKERIWRELEDALSECKTAADMTNRLRVIDMMGKYHDLWSNKLTVCVEQSTVLSAEDRKYLAELSRLHLASGTPQLIEACFQPDSNELHTQDTVCQSNQQQTITDNQDNIPDSMDCNTIQDNELQSNESDNPSATEEQL